jgi:hypothetical protein
VSLRALTVARRARTVSVFSSAFRSASAFLSRLGHARPSITLDVYAHEFEQAQHADDVSSKLTAAFGGIIL